MKHGRIKNLSNRWALVLAVVIVLAVILILEITDTTHFFHKAKVPPVIPIADNNISGTQQPSKSSSDDEETGSSSKDKGSSNSTKNSGLPLYEPYGVFVSNHTPGQNGAPTVINSTCNTTPGASCYIEFTQNEVTTKLPSKTTNGDGAATWVWDIKDANLTTGKWKITAVATLNNESKTSEDPIPLTIK
jgi:hypothetical protein